MEFRIDNKVFYQELSVVFKAVPAKTTNSVLTGIKLVVTNKQMTLIGANSDLVITKTIPFERDGREIVEIISTGTVTLPAKILVAIVKKSDEEIHMKLDQDNLVSIRSGDIYTTINGFIRDEFPHLPQINSANLVQINAQQFKEAIQQTSFAVSKSESKPVLTGVNMLFEKDKVQFVATNSYRLAIKEIISKSTIHDSFIVPTDGLNEFSKLILSRGFADEVQIFLSSNHILFKYQQQSLYTRLINGTYPNISSLMEKNSNFVIVVSKKKFFKAIDRACVFATEWENNNVNIRIKDNKMEISSNSTEYGVIKERQSINVIRGVANISISFDGMYLLESLKRIVEEEISLSFGQSMTPLLIEPVNNSLQRYLISPVRTR